jgi:hypothetical protein
MVEEVLKSQQSTKERDEKIKLIGLILDTYVKDNSDVKCGDRFDKLYDASLPELKIYYLFYKTK